jgi:hypothetical protein
MAMISRVFAFAALASAVLAGCSVDEAALRGEWAAEAFYKNGQTASLPHDSVRLGFLPNGLYYFTSVGHYREAGRYRTSMYYLFLTDTTTSPEQEHILKVLFLSTDTLKLRMERDGEEQQLVLLKKSSGQ